MVVFLPANGGLPTIASNPPFARANTSGNSICQWNGGIGCLPFRRLATAASRFWLIRGEESRDHRVTHGADRCQPPFHSMMSGFLDGARGVVGRSLNLYA